MSRERGRGKQLESKEVHLSDLSPQDKAKVARLVDQIIELGKENEILRKRIVDTESRQSEKLAKIEATMTDSILGLTQKVEKLEKNRRDSLQLLFLYQQKISQFVLDIQSSKEAQIEAEHEMKRYKARSEDLEKLLESQQTSLEALGNQVISTQAQDELLRTEQDHVKRLSEEIEHHHVRNRLLEETSKYLGNQIDELLPQLEKKNTRIKELENQLTFFETHHQKSTEETGVQTDFPGTWPASFHSTSPLISSNSREKSLHETISDCESHEDRFASSLSGRIYLESKSVQTVPFTSVDSVRVIPRDLEQSIDSSVVSAKQISRKVKTRGQNTVTSHPTSRLELKVKEAESKRDLRKEKKPVKHQNERSGRSDLPSFRTNRRSFADIIRDNDVYHDSLYPYGSSLFDLVDQMEVMHGNVTSKNQAYS